MSGNGEHITRAELEAHMRYIRADLAEIKERLDAPGRWIGARLSRLIDFGLVVGASSLIAVLATRL